MGHSGTHNPARKQGGTDFSLGHQDGQQPHPGQHPARGQEAEREAGLPLEKRDQ